MGKYTQLKKTVPQFQEEPRYQEKIDAAAEELGVKNMSQGELCQLFKSFKDEISELESQVTLLRTKKEAVQQELLLVMEEDDISSMKMTDGTLIYTEDSPYPSIKDQGLLKQWLKQEGMENLLTLNYKVLEGLCRERLLAGEAAPNGVEVCIKSKLNLRKG